MEAVSMIIVNRRKLGHAPSSKAGLVTSAHTRGVSDDSEILSIGNPT
jgi:hypothetical protein